MNKVNNIVIPKCICELLDGISEYNFNYYKLPEGMEIEKCNVILEICDEDYDSYGHVLGNESEGAFKDDENHIRYASSYGEEYLNGRIIIELDREGDYNT